jgi:hypothetical protein
MVFLSAAVIDYDVTTQPQNASGSTIAAATTTMNNRNGNLCRNKTNRRWQA